MVSASGVVGCVSDEALQDLRHLPCRVGGGEVRLATPHPVERLGALRGDALRRPSSSSPNSRSDHHDTPRAPNSRSPTCNGSVAHATRPVASYRAWVAGDQARPASLVRNRSVSPVLATYGAGSGLVSGSSA